MRIGKFTFGITKAQRQDPSGILATAEIENAFEEALAKWDWARGQLVNTMGCAEPPYDPYLLAALAKVNGYHSNALYWKQAATVGQGYDCSDALRSHIEYVNEDQTFEDFAEEVSLDLETYASAYVEVARNSRTANFYRSKALLTRVKPLKNGEVQFIQYEYERGVAINAQPFEPYRAGNVSGIRQIKLASTGPNRWYGEPEYISAKKLLTLNLSIVTLAEKWFENGMFLDKLITVKGGQLSPEQKNLLRQFINKTLKGVDNANKALLLELARSAELDIKSLGEGTKEASFTELRKENRDEIASAHRIPSKLLGIPSAGQLGASNEIAGHLAIFKMSFADARQRKLQAFFRRLFRDAGLPDADTFTLNPLNISIAGNDAAELAIATGGLGWLSADEAREEWMTEKGAFTAKGAASFVKFLKTLERMRDRL